MGWDIHRSEDFTDMRSDPDQDARIKDAVATLPLPKGGIPMTHPMSDTLTPALVDIIATKNPNYAITDIVNVIPFRASAERIGATAGRLYLREQNRLYAITTSDTELRRIARAILDALAEPDDDHDAAEELFSCVLDVPDHGAPGHVCEPGR